MPEMNADGGRLRCPWPGSDPLYVAYHDEEWGVPVYDDRTIFQFLVLEAAQAGLSWITVLRKRGRYREAFANFDPAIVASFSPADVERLLTDPGLIRNRRKIEAAVSNAAAFVAIQERYGSFAAYMWQFTDGMPIQNSWRSIDELPVSTPLAARISGDLVAHGFRFVGPTIVYAHMQATGMVNDHIVSCFRHAEVQELARSVPPRHA